MTVSPLVATQVCRQGYGFTRRDFGFVHGNTFELRIRLAIHRCDIEIDIVDHERRHNPTSTNTEAG